MITVELEHFSLDKICDSGQCFRMKKLGDGHFSMVAGDQYLEMHQKDGDHTDPAHLLFHYKTRQNGALESLRFFHHKYHVSEL